MAGGRRPKPTVLHKLQGTHIPSVHDKKRVREAVAVGDLGEPPPDLTDAEQDEWRYAVAHMPRHVVHTCDRNVLRTWVEASARHNTARMMQHRMDETAEWPLLVKTKNGYAPSPYNRILFAAAQTMLRCCQELGFSPAARVRLMTDLPGTD